MPSSIFFNGRSISRPGAYSEVDASGLNVATLGASGVVAILGTGEGGRPVSDITDPAQIPRYTSAERLQGAFRSGQIREAASMLFAPMKDPDIPAGAVEVVVLKTNPATQSAGVLTNADGAVLNLTSRDFGAFTEQISVDVQDGSSEGKLVTISFEDLDPETGDNIGGETLGSLTYVPGSDGYDAMSVSVNDAGDITASAERESLGLDSDIENTITAVAAEIVSADAGDTGLTVELFGISGGDPTIETLTLNGTTVVPGSTVWDAGGLLGVRVTGDNAGIVTVREIGGAGTDTFLVAAGSDQVEGLIECDNCYVNNGALTLVSDGASTKNVVIFGRNAAGATVSEVLALTGTTPVNTVADSYAEIDVIVLGDVEAAQTVTVSAEAAKSLVAVQDTLLKVQEYFNARQQVVSGPTTEGFVFTLSTGGVRLSPANLDIDSAGTSILSPADKDFTADVYALAAWINQNSQLISAVVASGATGVPDNTPTAVALTGGEEGTPVFAQYQAALDLLKRLRVNSIVDLSGDPAVHAAMDAHIALMCGVGKSERDGFVGLLNAALTGLPNKTEIKTQIVNLNTRHIRAVGQSIDRYNSAGERTTYLPPYAAAMLAGAQAGSDVGVALTHKYTNTLAVGQHATWNPFDDGEEMIRAGLCFMENVDGVGRRVVRNNTTYLIDNNIAYVEGSVNEAVNFAVFNYRTGMEFVVGQKNFAGTLGAARASASSLLGLLVDAEVIVGFRNVSFEAELDVLDNSVELAPVVPFNFLRIVAHLISATVLNDG